jgi:hypothetical protein
MLNSQPKYTQATNGYARKVRKIDSKCCGKETKHEKER